MTHRAGVGHDSQVGRLSWLFLATLGAGACTKALTTHTVQPNPMLETPSVESLRVSRPLFLDVGDMELPQYLDRSQNTWAPLKKLKLRSSAYFAVVSNERLRFHVQIVHKWQEWADPSSWRVKLVDDRGRVYYPETRDVWSNNTVTRMWDYEQRTGVYNKFGDEVGTRNDGYRRRVPLESVSVFKGKGDYTFKNRDLFGRELRRLTLVLRKADLEYRFEWEFGAGMPQNPADLDADPFKDLPPTF